MGHFFLFKGVVGHILFKGIVWNIFYLGAKCGADEPFFIQGVFFTK